MKITDVETILVSCPPDLMGMPKGEFLTTPIDLLAIHERPRVRRVSLQGGPIHAVLARVQTDEGICGVGSVGVGNGAAVYVIAEHLKPIVIGMDPFNVEWLWEMMFRSTINYGRKGLVLESISAVDIAIWDILGKATNQPLYNLLGGRTRERVRVYLSRLYANENLDALARQAETFLQQGYTAIKQRFGYGPQDGNRGMQKNLELVKTVRDVVGPDVDLMADAYMGWDVAYAIRMIRTLEDAGMNLNWVEEPLIPDDVEGYVKIRNSVSTPISAGEHEFTRYGFMELIRRGAVDILQPDVNRVGGITEARKIWALAAANNLPVIPHSGQLHNYHLVMAHVNSPIAEYFPPHPGGGALDDDTLFWEIFTGEPKAIGGEVEIGDKPGLGLELNEEKISAWKFKVD
jgi:L-lyxonate dehydratase